MGWGSFSRRLHLHPGHGLSHQGRVVNVQTEQLHLASRFVMRLSSGLSSLGLFRLGPMFLGTVGQEAVCS